MMPSSREKVRPLLLGDLEGEGPSSPAQEFVEQVDFADVQESYPPAPTPDEAKRAGFTEGEHVGRAAALKELEPVVARFEELIRALTHVRDQRIEQAESGLIEIATEIARRIVLGELQLQKGVVVRLARACVREAKDDGPRTLRVNPADLELVRAHLPDLEGDASETEVAIVADPRMPPGGVVLETPGGCYDGRPERILAAARHQIQQREEPES